MSSNKNPINYKKLLLEGLLIFMSITLAIAFENMNERRKEKEKEEEFLRSMAIELDRHIDLYENARIFEKSVLNSMDRLLQVVEEKEQYHDSLGQYFSNYHFYDGESAATPVYESLMSVGIDLIESHELRIKIATYYEGPTQILPFMNELNNQNYIHNTVPFHTDNFYTRYDSSKYGIPISSSKGIVINMNAIPNNFEALVNSGKFRNNISNYRFWRITMIDFYSNWASEAKSLKEDIINYLN